MINRLPIGTTGVAESIITRSPDDGSLTDADSLPSVAFYDGVSGTALGYSPTPAHLVTGIYAYSVDYTTANGFAAGHTYRRIITATVAGLTTTPEPMSIVVDATSVAQSGDAYARLGAPAGASVSADILGLSNKVGAPAGASFSADIAAVKVDTGNLATNYTGTRASKLDHLDVDVSTRLAPTVAARTLDVSATGGAGMDWANVESQATVVNLSNTAIASGGGGGSTDLTPVLTAVASVQADTTTLTGRLSSARATKLDNLDATVSSRLAPTVASRTLDVSVTGEAGVDWANIGSPTTANALSGTSVKTASDLVTTLGTPAGASISADLAAVSTKVGTPAGASVSADVAAIKTDTGNVAGRLTSARAGYLDNLSAGPAALEASVQAVKAKTDNLPAAPADESLIITATNAIFGRLGAPTGASVSADIGSALTRLGTPVGGSLSADVAGVRSDTTKIGNPAGASVSADIAGIKTDTGNVATRVTSARAGYLDNLSVGPAALEASVQAVKAKTDNLTATPADETAIIAATTAISNKIGTPAGASLSADVAGIQTKVGTPAGASVSADIAAVKTDTAAINAKTTNLPAAPADETALATLINSVLTRLGAPAGASAAADIAAIKALLPNALVGGRMDCDVGNMRNGVITNGSIADVALTAAKFAAGFIGAAQLGSDAVAEIRDAIFNEVVESTVTFIESMRGLNRTLMGKVSGVQNNRPVFRDLADTKDSIVATVDSFGNRLTVTADLT